MGLARKLLMDQASLQQVGPRIYEKSAPPVQVPFNADEDVPRIAASLSAGTGSAWVFVGQYLPDSKKWRTCYYCNVTDAAWTESPQRLEGTTITSTTPSFLRAGPPDAQTAELGRTLGALKVGQRVEVEEVEDWHNAGFIWAKVRVAPENSPKR